MKMNWDDDYAMKKLKKEVKDERVYQDTKDVNSDRKRNKARKTMKLIAFCRPIMHAAEHTDLRFNRERENLYFNGDFHAN